MDTIVLKTPAELPLAADILRKGGMAAVPTETVYGLCVNGLDEKAVFGLYEIKGRPEIKPMALMVPDAEALDLYGRDVPEAARRLARRCWPGPLTIVVPAKASIPSVIRAGGDTIGLRCPDHPLTLALLREAGLPLAGPSANPSGAPSPKDAKTVLDYFNGRIGAVVDGGRCGIGRESTILDMSVSPFRLLRQGAMSEDAIGAALREGLTIVGITGGTGSGKTTALNILRDLDALVLDCDAIYHELLDRQGEMVSEILARFPEAAENGRLDRKKLGTIVFSHEQALLELNAITHKHVSHEVERRLTEHAWRGGTLAAIDAIALVESGLADKCAFTVGVIAPAEERVRRIRHREGISEEYARLRIAAQKPDRFFETHCTHILRNDGSQKEFTDRCRELFGTLLK